MFLESAIIPDAFQETDMESLTAADNNYKWIGLIIASDIRHLKAQLRQRCPYFHIANAQR